MPEDLDLLTNWLNREHLRPWYQNSPIMRNAVIDVYSGDLASATPTHPVIACLDVVPFGYMQWYENRAYPDYGIGVLDQPDGARVSAGPRSIVPFARPPRSLRRVIAFFHVLYDPANHRAIRYNPRGRFYVLVWTCRRTRRGRTAHAPL